MPCDSTQPQRGQLLRAFVHHVDLMPYRATPVGRTDPKVHSDALLRIEPLSVSAPTVRSRLPVAALPQYPGECYTLHRSKCRWCLVIGTCGINLPKDLRPPSSPEWQTAPTMLAAPYYGGDQDDTRAGWHEPLVERIRKLEFPQYMLDSLPVSGKKTTRQSILRLDHIMPLGKHYNSFELGTARLCDEALELLDEHR